MSIPGLFVWVVLNGQTVVRLLDLPDDRRAPTVDKYTPIHQQQQQQQEQQGKREIKDDMTIVSAMPSKQAGHNLRGE